MKEPAMHTAIIAVVAAAAVAGGAALTGTSNGTGESLEHTNVACTPSGHLYPAIPDATCTSGYTLYVQTARTPLRARS
jgi:hypothetical protein